MDAGDKMIRRISSVILNKWGLTQISDQRALWTASAGGPRVTPLLKSLISLVNVERGLAAGGRELWQFCIGLPRSRLGGFACELGSGHAWEGSTFPENTSFF